MVGRARARQRLDFGDTETTSRINNTIDLSNLESNEIIEPSPVKSASQGLFASFSTENRNWNRRPKNSKRISVLSQVPSFFTNRSNAKHLLENELDLVKDPFLAKDKGSLDEAFGLELNKSSVYSSTLTAGVSIEEFDNQNLSDKYILGQLIVNNVGFKAETLNISAPSTQIPLIPKGKINRSLTVDSVIAKPNAFVTSRSLRRQSSLCNIQNVSQNYREFLTADEVKSFAGVIEGASGESVAEKLPEVDIRETVALSDTVDICLEIPEVPGPVCADAITESLKSMPAKARKSRIVLTSKSGCSPDIEARKPKATTKRPIKDKCETSDFSTDSEVDAQPAKKKIIRPSKSIPAKSKKTADVVTAAGNSAKFDSGWSTKAVSKKTASNSYGNFRSLNLKSKSQTSRAGGRSFGNAKFKNVKKLSSYNYTKSDGQYLLEGYNDEVVEDSEQVIAPVASFDKSCIDFFEAAPGEGLCQISFKYYADANDPDNIPVFVSLERALKALNGLETFRDGI